ncbi:hypothetical protein AOLI_G00193510 [Acnodon oligacanthus]
MAEGLYLRHEVWGEKPQLPSSHSADCSELCATCGVDMGDRETSAQLFVTDESFKYWTKPNRTSFRRQRVRKLTSSQTRSCGVICEFDDAIGAASGRAVAGVQGAREMSERTAPRSSGVKGRRAGDDAARPSPPPSAGRGVRDPAARRTVRSQIPKGLSAIVGVT